MKKYYLYYETTAGNKHKIKVSELFEFFQRLEKAMNDEYVIQHTIKFWTEEVQP